MAFAILHQSILSWCSSQLYVIFVMTFAVFVDTFFSAFIIPILPYILEIRIGLHGNKVQSSMSIVLSLFGITMFIFSPIAGIIIDKVPNRKWLLILGLLGQAVAAFLMASSTNMYLLCLSRIFQGAAASVLWITSYVTIASAVGSTNMGKTMGITGPIISSGAIFGPMTSGLLLSSVGYWYTWSIPVLMIFLDMLLRLAMIDRTSLSTGSSDSPPCNTGSSREVENGIEPCVEDPAKPSDSTLQYTSPHSGRSLAISSTPTVVSTPADAVEATPLIDTPSAPRASTPPAEPLSNWGFFVCILRQRRLVSSIIISTVLSTVFQSLDTTLALHVQDVFSWGPRQVGFLFLALGSPSVLLGPFAGWLRDSIGVRGPTIVGAGLSTALFIIIGYVGDKRIQWMQGDSGKAILIVALILMGSAIELTTGICVIEGLLVIDELEVRNPGIFGSQGGYARFFSTASMLAPLGSTLGPLLSGSLNSRLGYHLMNDIMALLSFMCLILTALLVGPRRQAR